MMKRDQSGFTLVELLVVMFIITLLGVAMSIYQRNVFDLNKTFLGGLDVQVNARRVMKLLTAEIRTMDTSNQGSYPIVQAATSSLIFYSNVDDDDLKERVRYFVEGGILKKGVIKPSGSPPDYSGEEVVENIAFGVVNATSTPIFEYYDTNYDGTTGSLSGSFSVNMVRLIKITFYLDSNTLVPPEPIVMTTQVSLRNLKDNL